MLCLLLLKMMGRAQSRGIRPKSDKLTWPHFGRVSNEPMLELLKIVKRLGKLITYAILKTS